MTYVPHCDNCGEAIEQDVDGEWLHTVTPPNINAALCVAGTADGVAYAWDATDAARAEPCRDLECDQTDEQTCAPPRGGWRT